MRAEWARVWWRAALAQRSACHETNQIFSPPIPSPPPFPSEPPPLRCENCKNTDETLFVEEYKSGDVICAACGAVAVEHAQYAGDWARSFEGEESTSQIGPRPDPLLSTR